MSKIFRSFFEWRPGIYFFLFLFLLTLPEILIYVNDNSALISQEKVLDKKGIIHCPQFGPFAYSGTVKGKILPNTIIKENSVPLALPNSYHFNIGRAGKGRYSVSKKYLFFSSSDNSDPRSNKMEYTVQIPLQIPASIRAVALLLFLASVFLFILKIKSLAASLPLAAIEKKSLLIIVVLSLLLHFVLLFSTPLVFIVDTDSYMAGAIGLLENGSLSEVYTVRGPGIALLYAPILFIFKSYSLWPLKIFIHLLAVSCSVMTYLLAYQLLKKRWPAFLAGLLGLAWTDAALYSSMISSEVPSALLVLLFAYFMVKALKEGKIRNYYLAAFFAMGAVMFRTENVMLFALFPPFALLAPLLSFLKKHDKASLRIICHTLAATVLTALPIVGWSAYNYHRAAFFGLNDYGIISLYDSVVISGVHLGQGIDIERSPAARTIQGAVAEYTEHNLKTKADWTEKAFHNVWYDTYALNFHICGERDLPNGKYSKRKIAKAVDKILLDATEEAVLNNPEKYIPLVLLKPARVYCAIWLYPEINTFAPDQSYEAWVPPKYDCPKYRNYFDFDSDMILRPFRLIFDIYSSFMDIFSGLIFVVFIIALPGYIICFFQRPLTAWWAFLSITFAKTIFTIIIGFAGPRVIFQGSYLNIILGVCTIWILMPFLSTLLKNSKSVRFDDVLDALTKEAPPQNTKT